MCCVPHFFTLTLLSLFCSLCIYTYIHMLHFTLSLYIYVYIASFISSLLFHLATLYTSLTTFSLHLALSYCEFVTQLIQLSFFPSHTVVDIVEAHCYFVDIGRIDCEQIRSRINNNDCRTFRPRRPLSTAYRTKETAV